MSAPKQGELVLEINHPKNSDVYFRPISSSLRSRFFTQRSGARYQAPLNAFTTNPIPGMRIHIDFKKRCCRITDPLGDPDNKGMLDLVNSVGRQLEPPRKESKPVEDREFRNLKDEDLHSWLYYARLLIEGHRVNSSDPITGEMNFDVQPHAVVIQGEFPPDLSDSLKIRQTGKVLTYNTRRAPGEGRFVVPVPENELEALTA